ncbi:acyl-CoA dehydrogenase family protein [Nocardia abscessus]|uniref:Acyl-CoA dehydrogenase family protein n=1 Tax=Nocardia abscessus TaxID=120957 RepID=A0ABS0C1I4_9NOCA|nr:acyl-CoA dehydrogenase family protein [Nocardia abscessus]MBF6224228.1 acyl-CoA dehydrogenase family protein [Nocardia abscessus]
MTTAANNRIETIEDVLARIKELTPLIRKNAAEGDSARRVSEETIDALKEAGAFRILVPRRVGGLETSSRALLDVTSAIAEADGGAAWIVMLSNTNAWIAALKGGSAFEEMYAASPDLIVAGVLTPSGTVRKVAGGYWVNGRWPYASASLHADWATNGALLVDDDGQVLDQVGIAMPRADFQIEDTWYVAGMRASGSNTIVAEDVFVPDTRVSPLLPILTGEYISEHPDAPLYRSAMTSFMNVAVLGPQLGLGRAALELVRTKAAEKALAYTTITRQADSVAFQLLVAEAAMKIETAHLHAYRATGDVQAHAEAGIYPAVLDRARIRGDIAIALRSINEALTILLDAHGSGAFAEVNAMQRIWRDSNIAARHAVTLPHVSMETYGKALLGIPEHITPLI